MIELTEEDIKNFQGWSEGNKYLFELLCNCKKNGIKKYLISLKNIKKIKQVG